MKVIQEPARETVVADEADVVVAGGGPAGLVAAIAAARTGAETVLIERYAFLGGMATAGLVTAFATFTDGNEQIIQGIPQQILDRLKGMGGVARRPQGG